MLPPAPRIGSTMTAANSLAVPIDQLGRTLDVVVDPEHEIERDVERRRRACRKSDDAAVVGALEDQDLFAASDGSRRRQGHDVGLGPGVAEPDLFDRGEALANQGRQLSLVAGRRTHRDTEVERLVNRCLDGGVRVAEQAGGVLADEVDVPMPVEVDELCSLTRDHGQRKRIEVQDRAGIAARKRSFRCLVRGLAQRIGGRIPRPGVFDGLLERFHSQTPSRTRAIP